MAQTLYRLIRNPEVLEYSGGSRSGLYRHISEGLMTPPVKLSARSVAWPESEIVEINRARIAGKSDDEIRRLVADLVAARTAAQAA